MIEIHPNLFIGNSEDAKVIGQQDWYVIHAARDPWHRQALGYTGKGAPKEHPEYLMARRDRRLIMNLVDAADPAYIPESLINVALEDIRSELAKDERKVLVHCNAGHSRAPTIVLLFLRKFTDRFADKLHWEAVQEFKRLYPDYAPAGGMDGYAKQHWDD